MARCGLYQPFVEDRNVRRLYRLKIDYRERTRRKVSMTSLLNRILDDFFDAQGEEEPVGDAPSASTQPAGAACAGTEARP